MPGEGATDRWHARSMTLTKKGMVAASQTLAAQAGAQCLARGGSAVDAALTANIALTVVEPMQCGVGGDLFALVWRKGDKNPEGLNASGPAPRGLTVEKVRAAGYEAMPAAGILPVTVPGAVAGWQALHSKYGRRPWAELFAPAIELAAEGFPVTEIIAGQWAGARAKLEADEYARGVFLPGGKAPEHGAVFRNPDLARTLRLLAEGGAEAFYRGPVGRAVLEECGRRGGVHTAEDLAGYQPERVEPIATTYRGARVYEIPPNGIGITALLMLNLMERFELSKMDPFSADAYHVKIEAQKLAYQDMVRYVGDPRFVRIPVDELLSKSYAAGRAKLVDLQKAACAFGPGRPPLEPRGDTIYLAAADREGTVVSLIQSLFSAFGSGVAVRGGGFHLHNRGVAFRLEEGRPNVLRPGKRPFHTIIPGAMQMGTRRIGFGIMGGLNQPQAHAQFVSWMADHGFHAQQALEAPRFVKYTFTGCDVRVESRVSEAVRGELARRGHELEVVGAYSPGDMGGGQAVVCDDATGVKAGASSPRKDGAAIPEP